MLCAHATNIKKTLALGQTLMHEKTSSLEISFSNSLLSSVDIKQALNKTCFDEN